MGRGRDAHAAEDIFQTVALKAMEKEVDFESEGAVLSWAFITARRDGIDWLRRRRREPAGLDQEILKLLQQEWLSEPTDGGDARMHALRHCLDALPEKSKRLLRLRYFEQHSCAEVARGSVWRSMRCISGCRVCIAVWRTAFA